jgi:hypothetical protein
MEEFQNHMEHSDGKERQIRVGLLSRMKNWIKNWYR